MKKVAMVILIAAAAFCQACMENGGSPGIRDGEKPPVTMGPFSDSQKYMISDSKSAFCIVDNATLWDLTDGRLARKAGVTLGDRLELQGEKAKAVIAQRERQMQRVRASGGEEGWMRADQLAADSVLAVVTANAVVIYSQARLSAPTQKTIPFMTVLAISKDTAASDFLSISFYDEAAGTLQHSVLIRNKGISSWIGNVDSAIIYRIAKRTESEAKRQALLSSAITDYPTSAFADTLRNAAQAPAGTEAVPIP